MAPNTAEIEKPQIPERVHVCHLYRDVGELVEVLLPYFHAGLKRGQFCLWGVDQPLALNEAKSELENYLPNLESYFSGGQLEVFDVGLLYNSSSLPFNPKRVLNDFTSKIEASLGKGFSGFRCAGNTRGIKAVNWWEFQHYETAVNAVMDRYPMTAVCSYDLSQLTSEQIVEAAKNHQMTLLKGKTGWVFFETVGQLPKF